MICLLQAIWSFSQFHPLCEPPLIINARLKRHLRRKKITKPEPEWCLGAIFCNGTRRLTSGCPRWGGVRVIQHLGDACHMSPPPPPTLTTPTTPTHKGWVFHLGEHSVKSNSTVQTWLLFCSYRSWRMRSIKIKRVVGPQCSAIRQQAPWPTRPTGRLPSCFADQWCFKQICAKRPVYHDNSANPQHDGLMGLIAGCPTGANAPTTSHSRYHF